MAIDTRQKRMSAMNLASPWRGPLVHAPDADFDQGARQAALFMYAGIDAAERRGHSKSVPVIRTQTIMIMRALIEDRYRSILDHQYQMHESQKQLATMAFIKEMQKHADAEFERRMAEAAAYTALLAEL